MTAWIRILSLALALPASLAMGHGSMGYPVSRTFNGFQEGPESPLSDAIRDAVECGGTQPLYDWHEVVNFFPGTADYQRTVPYPQYIPDGRLASGDNDKYACFDAVRSDWPATMMNSGPTQLVWTASTVHNPSVFRVWLTTDDWTADTELNWDQMVELEVKNVVLVDSEYLIDVDLPERSGRHVLYCIWQRLDPVGEGFYSASDVIFGEDDGNDDGNDDGDDNGNDDGDDNGNDDDVPSEGPDSASISLVSQWDGSWQGAISVNNSFGDLAMLNWTLEWDGGPDIVSLWNGLWDTVDGRTIINSESWNAFIEPGGSVTVGFIAEGNWPPTFSNVTLNGFSIEMEGAPNDDEAPACPGDVNLDESVDVNDMLLVLDGWNSTDPGNPADVDGDGVVAVSDVLVMLEAWGSCP